MSILAVKAFFAANKVAVIAGGVAILLAIAATIYFVGRGDGKAGEVVKQQAREIEVQQDLGKAAEQAADTRVIDATRSEQQKKELEDAFKATDNPDRQRALRGCVILRQQGRDTSGIPSCSGSQGRP